MSSRRVAADRPFVDRPVADSVAAADAAQAAAREWGLPPPEPWRSGMNAIFRSGDVVMRVGHVTTPPDSSVELAEVLRAHGVRSPRAWGVDPVQVGALAVTAWHRLVERDVPVDWEEVGGMVARVHALDPSLVPDDYPLADPRRFPWWDFEAMLSKVGAQLDAAARGGLERAIERNADWVDYSGAESVVCHGDVHPGNVKMTADGAVLLDWDLMCLAPRGWDHGPLTTWESRWGGGAIYEPFTAGYGWSGTGDSFTEAVAELRLVAATLMRVRAARTDRSARAEAELRLRYWRGEPDAPAWTAQ